MKNINQRIQRYENQIAQIENLSLKEITLLNEYIQVTHNCLNDLREIVRTYGFESKQDEIHFFKCQKPCILSRLKYFVLKQEYLLKTEVLDVEGKKEFIKSKINCLKRRKDDYKEFYAYYKLDDVIFDDHYFTRGNSRVGVLLSPVKMEADPLFSTEYDFIVAEIKSIEMITEYFKDELFCFERSKSQNVEVNSIVVDSNLKWSGTKVELVELIYAILHSKLINEGNVDVKDIAHQFGAVLNIDISNIFKYYNDIKFRKKEKTKLLNKLTFNYSREIEKSIEF